LEILEQSARKRRIVMKWTIGLAAVVCLLLSPAALGTYARADDKGDIRALEMRFVEALKAKDVNAIMAAYVPDETLVVFDVVPPRQYVGWKAYKKDWEDFLALFDGAIMVALTDLHVTTVGSLGYGHSIQRVTGHMRDGKTLDLTVRVTDVYRKVKGKWLIVHEHVSVPVDLATGKPDLESRP
jgi:ketosteroid isomerase-like protein